MIQVKDIKPLGDRVLVKPISKEEKTQSGIIIPDTATKEKPEQGEVLAVGPGNLNDKGERVEVGVSVGQTVMFTKYGPTEIEVEKETYLVIRSSDILAVIG